MAREHKKSALDIVEEAVYVLRSAPASAFASYYLGTLSFLLAFLFFWGDMGRSATAYDHAAPAALGVAALFVCMSVGQAIFVQTLRSSLTGSRAAPFWRLVFVQATLQPTKFVTLPIAALITIPFAGVFAFYQNLMSIRSDASRDIREAYESAKRQAKLWQRQNWAILGLLSMLVVVTFANIAVLLFTIPMLLKSILGIDTALSRSEILPLNSTFLAIGIAVTYALIDPLIKAVYVLRCFYGEALATGEDLKAQLKALAAHAVLLAIVLSGVSVKAQPAPQPVAVHELDRSIDDVLKRPEFSWRLPHPPQRPAEKTWLSRTVGDSLEKLGEWVEKLVDWLHDHFRPTSQREPARQGLPQMKVWLYPLIAIIAFTCLLLSIKMFRKQPAGVVTGEAITAAVPDLASEDTTADRLPPDEWMRSARECIARNDLRPAVRALYFATLAYLGGHSLLAIDRGKSNNDYARELRRRARAKPEVVPAFTDTVGVFERTWYGMYEVDDNLIVRLEENLAKMRTCVEQ